MEYQQFAKEKPILYGSITVDGKSKIGCFKPEWWHHSNSLGYTYYSPKGNKGKGGFTFHRAYVLFINGALSVDAANGDPKNYI